MVYLLVTPKHRQTLASELHSSYRNTLRTDFEEHHTNLESVEGTGKRP